MLRACSGLTPPGCELRGRSRLPCTITTTMRPQPRCKPHLAHPWLTPCGPLWSPPPPSHLLPASCPPCVTWPPPLPLPLARKDPGTPLPFPTPTEKPVDVGLCQVPRLQRELGKGLERPCHVLRDTLGPWSLTPTPRPPPGEAWVICLTQMILGMSSPSMAARAPS